MEKGKVINITAVNFEEVVLKSDLPVFVDFWAPWCGPCKAIAPVIEELAGDFSGKVNFGKINVDEVSEYATKYSIRSIPTLILFKNGEIVDKISGSRSKSEFASFLETNI